MAPERWSMGSTGKSEMFLLAQQNIIQSLKFLLNNLCSITLNQVTEMKQS